MASVKYAIIDVNEFLSRKQKEGHLAEEYAQLEELYNKKLWHQLTLKLQNYFQTKQFKSGDLIDLYNNFITTFENKINPLALVEISSEIIKEYKQKDQKKDAIAFLQKIEPKVKNNSEALTLCKVLQGQIFLHDLQDKEETKKIIEELEVTLDDSDAVTPVHGKFYALASEYYRFYGPLSSFYRSTLRYLGCVGGGDNLPAAERQECAYRLCMGGMLADDVYNLGELLAHPIMNALEGTNQAWAGQAVRAFSAGQLQQWEQLKSYWEKDLDWPNNEAKLREKIAMLCIMEMAWQRSSNERSLTFTEIASATHRTEKQVELLVMKALAKKLIRGAIDQVDRTVRVSWVRPRALDRSQVALLADKLQVWCSTVLSTERLVQQAAGDVLTL